MTVTVTASAAGLPTQFTACLLSLEDSKVWEVKSNAGPKCWLAESSQGEQWRPQPPPKKKSAGKRKLREKGLAKMASGGLAIL